MKIDTARLTLIPCTEDFISQISDYEIGPHITGHVDKLQSDPSLLGWGPWFVLEKETNTIIGDIGFKGMPNTENVVEVGYGIIPSAQNKGYATEAVNEIIKWAFSSNQVNKVIAECLEDNTSSIKVLEKLSMKIVGSEGNLLKWELMKQI